VFDDDPLDQLGDFVALVDGLFEKRVDVLPLQDSIVLAPSSKSPAIAERLIRSPSFSSRWTSETKRSMSLKAAQVAQCRVERLAGLNEPATPV